MSESQVDLDNEILADLASLEHAPLDFVMWAFPWGEEGGELESMTGPEPNQLKVLSDLQANIITYSTAIQIALKAGHDTGKSALLCWIMLWAFSTKVGTRGRCTANTEKQLRTTLWVELAKWHRLFIANRFFTWTATRLASADPLHADTWRIDAIPWSADNPAAFAGLHNYGGRIIYVFDEAAGIDDIVWEVVDGVMREADTELLWVCASQPLYNTGRFCECFHKFEDSWHCYTSDSRDVRFGNKEAIEKTILQWGIDSDYVKVRIRGDFPTASTRQLFPTVLLSQAKTCEVQSQAWEPLILGVDVARAGSSESVAQFRRGRDARTIGVHRWHGAGVENPTKQNGDRIAELIAKYSPDAVFIDMGGYGGGVVDFLRLLGHTCVGVNFGTLSTSRPGGALATNKRAEMYLSILEWMREGGCISPHPDLTDQLLAIEFIEKDKGIQLLSKEDMRAAGIASPDWADALALTFAYPVSAQRWTGPARISTDYDPFAFGAIPGESKPSVQRGPQSMKFH